LADFDGQHIGSSNESRYTYADHTNGDLYAESTNDDSWHPPGQVQTLGEGSPAGSRHHSRIFFTALGKTARNKHAGPSDTTLANSTNSQSLKKVGSAAPDGSQPGGPSEDSSEPDQPEEPERERINRLIAHNGKSKNHSLLPQQQGCTYLHAIVPYCGPTCKQRSWNLRPHRFPFSLEPVHACLQQFDEDTTPKLWEVFDTPVHQKHWHSLAKRRRTDGLYDGIYLSWTKKTNPKPKDSQRTPGLRKDRRPPKPYAPKPRHARLVRQFRKYWIRKTYPFEPEAVDKGKGRATEGGVSQPPDDSGGDNGAGGPDLAPLGPQQVPKPDGDGAGPFGTARPVSKRESKFEENLNSSQDDTGVNGSGSAPCCPQQKLTSNGDAAERSGTVGPGAPHYNAGDDTRHIANAEDRSSPQGSSGQDDSEPDIFYPPSSLQEKKRRLYNLENVQFVIKPSSWSSLSTSRAPQNRGRGNGRRKFVVRLSAISEKSENTRTSQVSQTSQEPSSQRGKHFKVSSPRLFASSTFTIPPSAGVLRGGAGTPGDLEGHGELLQSPGPRINPSSVDPNDPDAILLCPPGFQNSSLSLERNSGPGRSSEITITPEDPPQDSREADGPPCEDPEHDRDEDHEHLMTDEELANADEQARDDDTGERQSSTSRRNRRKSVLSRISTASSRAASGAKSAARRSESWGRPWGREEPPPLPVPPTPIVSNRGEVEVEDFPPPPGPPPDYPPPPLPGPGPDVPPAPPAETRGQRWRRRGRTAREKVKGVFRKP
jgi:hypothetical protein